jgi:hypothetical protein
MPDKVELLVYAPRVSSRSKYIFRLYFSHILRIKHRLTNDIAEFNAYKGPRFSYAGHPVGDELFFYASGLLFESGITVQELNFMNHRGLPCFYSAKRKSALPFDPFAAAFFLVSRYEEYLPHIKDQHGRFSSAQSVAALNGFLRKPLVNIWAGWIREILEERFPTLKFTDKPYKFTPTIDIDNAWAYKRKGFIRIGGGILADLINLDFNRLKERIACLILRRDDPYDTYDYQVELIKKYQLEPIYFILMGDYAAFDKNVPHQNKHFQSLIKFLADFGTVGIHPSYASNDYPEKLKSEISRLSGILHREIHCSRQHFLRLNLPHSYQRLLEYDITDDYTMGYPDQPGFRASICTPFFFYDLDLEFETSLKVHPFCLMDGTLKDYMKLEPHETFALMTELVSEVKAVHGEFIAIWHNESFAENERWKGWRAVFEYLLKEAA